MVTYGKGYFTTGPYTPYQDFPGHEVRFKKILQKFGTIKSFVDIGCAYGYIVKRFLKKGIPAKGVDISEWCEQQKIIEGNFIRHDIRNPLPFKDKEFDVLYCEGVLEHFTEEEIDKILKEFERVSERRLLAITFNGYGTQGHLVNQNWEWWFEKIPSNTWLYIGEGSSDIWNEWRFK